MLAKQLPEKTSGRNINKPVQQASRMTLENT